MIDNDFIAIYDDVITAEHCQKLIECFKFNADSQKQSELSTQERKDLCVFVSNIDYGRDYMNEIHDALHPFVNNYIKDYPVLENVSLSSYIVKLQETKPSGGYHIWHYENSSWDVKNRVLVWTIYLNDIEDGGETEFIYQSKRIKPKKGSLLIFPAGFTHTHRGNPPLKDTKYIATGWYVLNH
tara:strand:- start:1135 stop:1683 length:549 start_codon:yes stop_codon:yes gene_type:complete